MEHSTKYSRVKECFDYGFWSAKMVSDAVVKNWITADEYKEITGEDYKA